jgi:hypothetical protein
MSKTTNENKLTALATRIRAAAGLIKMIADSELLEHVTPNLKAIADELDTLAHPAKEKDDQMLADPRSVATPIIFEADGPTWKLDSGLIIRLLSEARLKLAPDGTVLYAIDGERVVVGVDKIDNDTRGGWLGYGVLVGAALPPHPLIGDRSAVGRTDTNDPSILPADALAGYRAALVERARAITATYAPGEHGLTNHLVKVFQELASSDPRPRQQCSRCGEWCAHGFCGKCEVALD